MTALTFRKRERMVSQRLIDDLFVGGNSRSPISDQTDASHSIAAFPLRVVYKLRARDRHEAPLQMLVSVPKKHFHHAVDRNRVKRQVREAWRLHKQQLVETIATDKQLLIAFIWQSDSMLSTQKVETRVANLVKRLQEKI